MTWRATYVRPCHEAEEGVKAQKDALRVAKEEVGLSERCLPRHPSHLIPGGKYTAPSTLVWHFGPHCLQPKYLYTLTAFSSLGPPRLFCRVESYDMASIPPLFS